MVVLILLTNGCIGKERQSGFGARSWRYSLLANDGIVEVAFVEDDVVTIAQQTHMKYLTH